MELTISYREGRAYAAYLSLPRAPRAKSYRQREMAPDLIVDFDRAGNPMGIEILDPRHATWTKLNNIMDRLHLPRLPREWVRPLRAA
jgi:uncharacterized protein YuzE